MVGGKPEADHPSIRAQTVMLCSQQTTGMHTSHRIDRDVHWPQFGTQPILISAPQRAYWSCNAPTQFYMVGKKPSVKADLAIYSQAVDVRGRRTSESLILGPRGPTLTGISYKDAVNQKNHSINQESTLQIIINHKSPKQIANLKYKSANCTNHCLNQLNHRTFYIKSEKFINTISKFS